MFIDGYDPHPNGTFKGDTPMCELYSFKEYLKEKAKKEVKEKEEK